MISDPHCFRCANLDRSNSFNLLRCRAFAEMIPVPVQMNKHDHRKPYPGDHDIRFEPIEKRETAANATAKKPRKITRARGRHPQ